MTERKLTSVALARKQVKAVLDQGMQADTAVSVVVAAMTPSVMRALASSWVRSEFVSFQREIELEQMRLREEQARIKEEEDRQRRAEAWENGGRQAAEAAAVERQRQRDAEIRQKASAVTLDWTLPEIPSWKEVVSFLERYRTRTNYELKRNKEAVKYGFGDALFNDEAMFLAAVEIAQSHLDVLPPDADESMNIRWLRQALSSGVADLETLQTEIRRLTDNVNWKDRLEQAFQEELESRGYGDMVRFTEVFLSTEFALPGGSRVTWGDASVHDHESRVQFMTKKLQSSAEDILLHRQVIELLGKCNVKTLRDVDFEENGQ